MDDEVEHAGQAWSLFALMINNVEPGSLAGCAGLTMPCGRDQRSGVPFGIEIGALEGADERLINIGRALERAL